jgi:hypothetical protein
MCAATITPYCDPFDKLSQRTILKFTKGGATVVWSRLDVAPKWDKVVHPQKFLFAIEDLGRGASGRVWLVSTSSGAVGVLKFSLSDRPKESLDTEYAMWKAAYPSMPVYREVWCDHEALRMPHFASVVREKRQEKLSLVKQALLDDFFKRELVHEDVSWRNIGTYIDRNGMERVVLFDMGSVRLAAAGESNDWVDHAVSSLKSSCFVVGNFGGCPDIDRKK